MNATGLLLGVLICASTGGELTMAYGMKAIGEPHSMHPKALLAFLGRAIRSGWLWVGIALMAVSFYSLLALLSWHPVSFVIPASSLSYVVGTLGAKYILREEISGARWAGVLLVCVGVAFVAGG